jgi:dipeptidase D
MPDAIQGLKPEGVWKYFGEISRIPRGSKNEKQIAGYVMAKAKELGLEAKQDKFMNVVVRKPAASGRDKVGSVCLQGHLDMVCEKNKDKTHDFEKDPIEIVRRGDTLMANGTTLGADNGIAVATNLAIMADRSLVHGPLEFLFTVDEETGLTGANNLAPGFLKSRRLMNLDSEEEGALYVGCSGGCTTTGRWSAGLQSAPRNALPMTLHVRGLKGGHSGLEIDKGRGNSLKILNRVLLALLDASVRISRIEGGNKSNAIPREAEALLYVPESSLRKVKAIVERLREVCRAEVFGVDPDLEVRLEKAEAAKKAQVLKDADARRICRTLAALPHGVTKMSADIPGLVETSTNLAIARTRGAKVEVTTSQRSSVASEIEEIVQRVGIIFEMGEAKPVFTERYPGWKPDLDSPILKVAKTTYHELYGKDPAVKAIHAGLECGIIGEKYPGIDMVSLGPTLEGVHSPDEKIFIGSVERFWEFLLAILKKVN